MASYTSVKSGDASDPAVWVGGVAPADGDTITVANGHAVAQDVSRAYGSNASNVGHAFTVNGTSSATYGKLIVPSGVTLTLRGTDPTTNTLGLINQYGWLDVQPGATVLGDVAADFGSKVLNKGRLTASGATFSVPAANVSWGTAVFGTPEAIGSNVGLYQTHDSTPSYVYAWALGNPWLSNGTNAGSYADGTGPGSFGAGTPTFAVTSPGGILATEVAGLAAVNGAGKFFVDYELGIVYFYTTATSFTVTAKYGYLTSQKTWGIDSTQNTAYNLATFAGSTFNYMGRYNGGTNSHFAVSALNKFTAGANSAATDRVFSFTGNTMRYCGHGLLVTGCAGTAADPIPITGNTFYHHRCAGTDVSPTYGAAVAAYLATNAYLSVSGNTLRTRSVVVTLKGSSATQYQHVGLKVDSNTGTCANLLSGQWPMTAAPSGSCSGNTLAGVGLAIDSRVVVGVGGTASGQFAASGNRITNAKRGIHLAGYMTVSGNQMSDSYHHGLPGDVSDDTCLPGVVVTDNLGFWFGPAAPGTLYTGPLVEMGYNHRLFYDAPVVANNTAVGHPYGVVGLGDCTDNSGNTLISNAYYINNLAYYGGGTAYGAQRTSDTTARVTRVHCLQFDNGAYHASSGGTGGTYYLNMNPGGTFSKGGANYNALTSASRDLPGLALFSPSSGFPSSAIQVAYTDTTPGTAETLTLTTANGAGTAVSVVHSRGTVTAHGTPIVLVSSAYPVALLLNDTGAAWSTTANSAACPRARWLKVTSGRLSGQVRAVTNNTATSVTVTPFFLAAGGGAGNGAITSSTNASPVVVTSAGHGLAVGDVVAVGGSANNTGANGVWTVSAVTAGTFTLSGSTGTGAGTLGYWAAVPAVGDSYTVYESEVQLADGGGKTVQVGLCGYTQSAYPVFAFGGATASDSGIAVAPHDVTSDPLLANASGSTPADFKLTASSPAKGAGVVVGGVTPAADFFGTPFNSPPSIGFAEFVAAGGLRRLGFEGGFSRLDGGF